MIRYLRVRLRQGELAWAVADPSEQHINLYRDPGWDQFMGPLISPMLSDLDLSSAVLQLPGIVEIARPNLGPGDHYARMWRLPADPPLDALYREEFSSAIQATRNLVQQMRDVFLCVEPAAANLSAYGHEICQVLILACTEVEVAWKAILRANGAAGDSRRWNTNDYVQLLAPIRLAEWELSLVWYPGMAPTRPFQHFHVIPIRYRHQGIGHRDAGCVSGRVVVGYQDRAVGLGHVEHIDPPAPTATNT